MRYNVEVNMQFGLPVLLTIVFVVLKLTEVITWSWLWVLSPLWISLLLTIVIGLVILIFFRNKISKLKGNFKL